MSNFQFIPVDYRKTDVLASGIPIDRGATVRRMRNVDRSEFGARLYTTRKEAGLSQQDLADAAGLSQSNIAELEKSGQGSAAITKLARRLGVDPHWLAYGEGEKTPSYGSGWSLQAIEAAGLIEELASDDEKEFVLRQINRVVLARKFPDPAK